MSQFSGKCDIYDRIEMISCDTDEEIQEYIDKTKFYIMHEKRKHELHITNRKELALYYPYLETMGYHSEGFNVIHVSSDSYIDMHEKEHLEILYDYIMKIYKKCKREKKPFIEEDVLAQCWSPSEEVKEIIRRIAKDGRKATLDGIHTKMAEHYRRGWYDTLVSLGWDEIFAFNWVYKELFTTEEVRAKRLKQGE